jgi:hypothetical protein
VNHTTWLVGMVALTVGYLLMLAFSIRREYRAGNDRGRAALGFTCMGGLLGMFIENCLSAI